MREVALPTKQDKKLAKSFKAVLVLFAAVIIMLWAYPVNTFALDEGVSVSTGSGDQVRLFEDIRIDRPVSGNIISVLGDVTLDSSVDGQIIAVFGDVTVNSKVSRQVVTVFGKTVLTDKAEIKGDLITLGSIEKADGAKVEGNEVRIFGRRMDVDVSAIFYLRLVGLVGFSLVVLIWGVLMLLLSKKKYTAEALKIEEEGSRKLLLGILSFLGTAILLILLSITLIGPVLYMVLMIIANVYASIYFGRLIMKAMSAPRNIMAEFFTGFITITLVKLLVVFLVPQQQIVISLILGIILYSYVCAMGLGIMMEGKFGKKQ
ncbi:MAG: polymer-forming cytoskeletal protein [Clostridiales bacterium]|nr:polymer-forming cytoskeletal protein [Clostridiales bacterium]